MILTKQNKKIVFVINTLMSGGAEGVVQKLSEWFSNNNFDVSVIVFSTKDQHYQLCPSVNVFDLDIKNSYNIPKTIYKLRQTIKQIQPNIVLSMLDNVNFRTLVSTLFMKNKPDIFVRECVHQSIIRKSVFSRLTYRVLSKLYTLSSGVIGAPGLLQDIHDVFGVPEKLLIPICVPVDIDKCQELAKEPINHKFLENKDGIVIVTGAKLDYQKDYPTLLRAISIVNQQQNCRLIALGKGPLLSTLIELSKNLRIQDKVDFIGAKTNPFPYFRSGDIFVLSSRYEGFPNALLEAMACGTPVISTDCKSGPSDIINDGINGYLVPIQSPRKLAEAIIDMMASDSKRNKMKQQALIYVRENYSVDIIANKYKQAFETTKQ